MLKILSKYCLILYVVFSINCNLFCCDENNSFNKRTNTIEERKLWDICKEFGTLLKNKIIKAKNSLQSKTPKIVKTTIEKAENQYQMAVNYIKDQIEKINKNVESDPKSKSSKTILIIKKIPEFCVETSTEIYNFSKKKTFDFLFERKSNLIDIEIRDSLSSKETDDKTKKIYEKIKENKKNFDEKYTSGTNSKNLYELIILYENEIKSFFKKYKFMMKQNNSNKDIIDKEIECFFSKLDFYKNYL